MEIFNTLLIAPLTNGLILFYRFLGNNMGFAIIGFSFFLRIVLNPLTTPYMESMKNMKQIEPLVAKLKKKYKDDQKKFLEAQTELYRQKGVNPGAGCLPYLLQIVVLIALFNVFTKVLSANGDGVYKLNELLYSPLEFGQDESLNTKFLYLDVSKPDSFKIPSLPFSLPGPILLLSALVQFLSSKMMSPELKVEKKVAEKTEGVSDDIGVAMQQSMSYTFPLLTLFIGLSFPSGLALYWLLFSLFQAYQQYNQSGWGGAAPLVNKAKRLFSGTTLRG